VNIAADNSAMPMSAAETYALPADPGSTIRVLIVDDDQTLADSCASVLSVEGYDVRVCPRGREAATLLKRGIYDIVLLDLNMTQVSGMELLHICLETHPDTIAIILTGNPSVESSVHALRAGAWDYLPKPFAANHLQILIGRAAHAVQVARESAVLAEARKEKHGSDNGPDLLGESLALRQVISVARRVAATDASVFISGESGVGKEQIVQFIHQNSRRSSRPLVAINCAAVPESLLETEMFGHLQGAFTGAVRDKAGLLEAANGGTLFLDEITEMPLVLQAKLLRVIQDGVVRRLGSTSTDAVVNVRFIAATNRDLNEAVATNVLRKDLFYRLCVVPIHIPPLRERPEDIPVLAQHFLDRYWARHREPGTLLPTLSPEALDALQAYAWPGNVRELENIIEHSVVLLEAGAEIKASDMLGVQATALPPSARPLYFEIAGDDSYHALRDRMLLQFEQAYLRWLVARADGNMSRAARIAGVDRTTLYRIMEKHGLHRGTIITSK
jgi:DNA-binding NtrC family response regulator